MPQFRRGDMWTVYEQVDLFLVTTNSSLRADGALVMGRGSARQARNRYPGLAAALGAHIGRTCGSGGQYGLLISPRWPAAKLGCFQVKTDWRGAAEPALIAAGVAQLTAWCADRPEAAVALNFPGIGNGRLRREEVLPLLRPLPAQVTLWEYPPPGTAYSP